MIDGFAFSSPPLTMAKRILWESPWSVATARLIPRRFRHDLWKPGLAVPDWTDLKGVKPVYSVRDGPRCPA